MDPNKLETQIQKTGFVLENEVAQILRKAGWSVISNKYYVDDYEGSVREIDLIAYQVTKVQHLDVYTVLIISCKKSESNTWALLARKNNLKDPNYDWWPLHAWSNDKALAYQLMSQGFSQEYHTRAAALGVSEALAEPSVEVFAFQEMNQKTGAPQNDKPIFAAVTSLMKAQAYELGALPLRKKDPSIYQFNLLSVVDADLARLMFTDQGIKCTEISSEHHLARYIIKKKDTFSRIRFIRANTFRTALGDYGRLHKANQVLFAQACDAFYTDILGDLSRTNVFIEEFKRTLSWWLNWEIERKLSQQVEIKWYRFTLEKDRSKVHITIDLSQSQIDLINSSERCRQQTAKALEGIYRYKGAFEFEFGYDDDIPF
ncbi:MAG: hypothetical protein IPP78_07255 [Holophagaceae bacterium]|nr:hypothetical protein [Holophagaceae bacterium]